MKYVLGGTAGAAFMTLFSGGVAFAQADDPVAAVVNTTNMLWVVLGAVLVIFMQAGFALVETGFCRAKHAAHVVSTNFAIFGLGFIGFFFVGFPFAFGGFSTCTPLTSAIDWARRSAATPRQRQLGVPVEGRWALSGGGDDRRYLGFFLYMVAFMDTDGHDPHRRDGRAVEVGQLRRSGACSAAPSTTRCSPRGRGAAAGSPRRGTRWASAPATSTSPAAAWCTPWAASPPSPGRSCSGPRIGKFGADGKPRALPGHHIPMAMLGTFILLFGWFGFNAASTFAATDVQFAVVAANTAIAGAFGAIIAMLWITKRTGKPDPGMMANGMLAGLVAITAPCAFVSPAAAAVIGIDRRRPRHRGGVLRRAQAEDRRPGGRHRRARRQRDVRGAVRRPLRQRQLRRRVERVRREPVSRGCSRVTCGQFGAQLLGVVVIWTVILGIAFSFFKIQNAISKAMGKGGIRSKEDDEIEGLDLPEMGVLAYPEFVRQLNAESEVTGGS